MPAKVRPIASAANSSPLLSGALTPNELAERFELGPDQVRAALDYYCRHRQEIEGERSARRNTGLAEQPRRGVRIHPAASPNDPSAYPPRSGRNPAGLALRLLAEERGEH